MGSLKQQEIHDGISLNITLSLQFIDPQGLPQATSQVCDSNVVINKLEKVLLLLLPSPPFWSSPVCDIFFNISIVMNASNSRRHFGNFVGRNLKSSDYIFQYLTVKNFRFKL